MNKIYREQYISKLITLKDKRIIKVLTGIRRSGKSTILQEFKEYLLKNGVDSLFLRENLDIYNRL